MNEKLRDLKKQLVEAWKNFESRLSESHSFNLLKERYQSLNIRQQKLVRYFLVLFIFSALAYLPLSYFFSSVVYWGEFKEKQALSLDLLKMRNKIFPSFFQFSQEDLKNEIKRTVEKYSSFGFTVEDKRTLYSKRDSIYQIDFEVQLKHLNVKQAVKLGTELHNLSQSRLKSIVMEENKKYPKHYDVIYKVFSFVSEGKKAEVLPKKRKRIPRIRKRASKNEKIKGF